MSFQEMRKRAQEQLDRMLDQLEEKSELQLQDAGIVEKIVKTLEILESAEQRSGKASAFKEKKTEDLEQDFDE